MSQSNNITKAFIRIKKFLNIEQARVGEEYISSYFRHCPLIWMLCPKISDIVKSYCENPLDINDTYDTQTWWYKELLYLSGKKKTHTQNDQILMVGVYKCLNNISPSFKQKKQIF